MDKMRLKNMVHGAAVGDALGVPYDGAERDMFQCKGMQPCFDDSFYHVPAGTWSDKTGYVLMGMDIFNSPQEFKDKMASTMLLEGEKGDEFMPDPAGISERQRQAVGRFLEGAYSAVDPPFTMPQEMIMYDKGMLRSPADNGMCILQTLPLGLYDMSPDEYMENIMQANATLYNTPEQHIACLLAVMLMHEFYIGVVSRASLLNMVSRVDDIYRLDDFAPILDLKLNQISWDALPTGRNTVDVLINSFWILFNTSSFKDAVLKAVALGGEFASGYGCIVGAMAGVLYNRTEPAYAKKLVQTKRLSNSMSSFYIPEPNVSRPKGLFNKNAGLEKGSGGGGMWSNLFKPLGAKDKKDNMKEKKMRSKYDS